jgi:hypothetical protein
MANISRRKILGAVGLGASAGLLAASRPELEAASKEPAAQEKPNDWKYVRLAPESVAEEAYRSTIESGCMYGVFNSIFNAWQKASGIAASFPVHMMRYGSGGTGGWGTLCGALNGAAALVGLFERDKTRQQKLIAAIFSWYEATPLPVYQPKNAATVATSTSNSVLCHVSVSRWVAACKTPPADKNRHDRCARLTADVAMKTIEVLNNHLDEPGAFTASAPAAKTPAVPAAKNANEKPKPITVGKMKCNVCHGIDNP